MAKVDAEELFQVIFNLFIGQHVAVDPRGRAVMVAAI
jgi:hypothetical protein